MTPEEIQAMAKGLAEGQAVWYVLSALIGGLITGAGAYWAEKGKNRATKEDIGQITQAVEAVKSEFSEKLEDLKAHHQLRMVAAERRLQAHQEAYTHWRKLVSALHTRKIEILNPQITAANQWFQENCLFLGVRSRKAMHDTLHAAWLQPSIERKQNLDISELIGNSLKIDHLGEVLLEEINLPPMSIQEMKDLTSPL